MEVDYTEDLSERELKICRNYMNSKIDIFQSQDGYVFRNKNVKQNFQESYEHIQMQNNAARILSSASDQLVFSLAKEYNNLDATTYTMKKTFTLNKIEEKEYDINYVENEYNSFKNKIMRKKLQNDADYRQLCEFIDSPRFNEVMLSNRQFLRYILNHKYFIYHTKHDEINQTYRKYLCPMFNQNQSDSQNDT
jgi:hypothetical protein